MSRTSSHLKLVVAEAAGREAIGPYALRGPLADHGHPALRQAWRQDPEALRARYAILLLERTDGRLPAAESALLRNAARAMGVRHPATVRIRDLVGDRDGLAIVTDFVPGMSFETVLQRLKGRPVPREVALAVAGTLLEALDDIHSMPREKGRHALPAAHGDVRARNLMLADDGAVRLLGFGLPLPREAFELGGQDAAHSNTTGELWFPTPEGDQFAAGLFLLRLLCRNTGGLNQSRGPGPDPAHVQNALRGFDLHDPLLPVLLKMLARRSEHRFTSCAQAAEQIRHIQEDDGGLVLARFAARLHQDEHEETDVGVLPPMPGEDETATDRLPAAEIATQGDLDVSITARSEDDATDPAPQARATVDTGFDPLDRALDVSSTAHSEPVAQPSIPSVKFDSTDPDPSGDSATHAPIDVSITAPSDPSASGLDPQSISALEAGPEPTNLDPDTTNPFNGDPAVGSQFEDSQELAQLMELELEEDGRPLGEPANEWAVDNDEEEIRTVPAGAAFERRPRPPGANSQPGRTVPYSPAFVPRASKWRPEDRPQSDPLNTPWAAGLMSGVMDAVDLGVSLRGAPSVEEPGPSALDAETRPFIPEPPPVAPPAAAPFQAETTAIPAPPVRTAQPPRPRRRKRSSGGRRRRRSNRLSRAAERVGLYKLLQDSWVLTLFTVVVMGLLIYSGWQIWLRTQAAAQPEEAAPSRLLENVE